MKHLLRFHSEGSETSNSSSFPHRTFRKTMPSIASKMIPVHKLQINRGYKGSTVDVATFDHWAYVPPQLNKKQIEKMYHQLHVKSKQKEKNTHSAIQKYSDRSQLALKQYLKRKQQKSNKDMMYYSQIINLKKKESLFERSAGKTDYLSLQSEKQHNAELTKKEHLKARLKHSWFSKRQKIMEHLRQRQSYNVTSSEFKRSKDNCNDKLYPPRYTHLPRDSKGFLITHEADGCFQQFFNVQE